MTRDEVKYIHHKKLLDELEAYKIEQSKKGVLTGITQAFCKKKNVCQMTLIRYKKYCTAYEQGTGRNDSDSATM